MVNLKVFQSLLLLGLLLLFTSTTRAESEGNLDEFNNNKAKSNNERFNSEKISTSLIVRDNHDIHSTEVNNLSNTATTTINKVEVSVSSSSSYKINNSNSSRDNITDEQQPAVQSKADEDIEDSSEESGESFEPLPEALELRSARPGSRRRPVYRPPPPRRPLPNSNRRNVYPVEAPLRGSKRPSRKPIADNKREPTEQECTFFGRTVCLKTLNYPQEAIMRSIRGNHDMMIHLLKDYNIQRDTIHDDVEADVFPLENRYDNRFDENEIKRRSDYPSPFDNTEEGFTCPSQVMYARPQLARAASGVWKYIINTGEHTQTLRLEKCSKPKSSCSFISDNYRSSCVQVYNYHRLLTWDKEIGLHIDIFKIPSCCSCHVHGYTELYPPIQKDPSSQTEENFPGYDFSQNKDTERPTSYFTKFKPPMTFDSNHGNSKPILDASSSNHASYLLPNRPRPKKPQPSTAIPRPFDKIPHQHAPNTRAPGYKGPVIKSSKRPLRPIRPYRRDSAIDDNNDQSNPHLNSWFEQPYDPDTEASTRIQNGNFDDEDYPESNNRRINYNYHPIIEFFEPKASMLKAAEPIVSTPASSMEQGDDPDSWKPMIST